MFSFLKICIFFFFCILLGLYVCAQLLQLYLTLCDPLDYRPPWDSPGINTGMGCHTLLQENSTQGPNLCLLNYRWILYLLCHLGSPRPIYSSRLHININMCRNMHTYIHVSIVHDIKLMPIYSFCLIQLVLAKGVLYSITD